MNFELLRIDRQNEKMENFEGKKVLKTKKQN